MGILQNIRDGWGNYLKFYYAKNIDPEILDTAKKRAEICKTCPSLKESKIMSIVETILPDGSKKEHVSKLLPGSDGDKIQGYQCIECGCGFPSMVFSLEKKCPIGKW